VACAKPILALRSGLLRGTIPGDRIAAIWGTPHHAGPLRAVQDACRRMCITINPANWTLVGPTVLPLLSTPKAQLDAFFGQAWHAVGRRKLIKRRPHLAAIGPELDHAAISASLQAIGPESQRAAMRVILADGVITQTRASHWVPGGKLCPHCQLEAEDVHHRMWKCPAWDNQRRDPMRGWTYAGLLTVLPRAPWSPACFRRAPGCSLRAAPPRPPSRCRRLSTSPARPTPMAVASIRRTPCSAGPGGLWLAPAPGASAPWPSSVLPASRPSVVRSSLPSCG
jgi:hypothetical protein